ncbi:RNA recognition motif domain-containing protein [Ditylenchus destructor]|uniref:RNA recognition motif domain-containing protein n=1 Tax=Ditylenchus destructor TaxID=166010 RepID=A0AAD4R1Y8_9BILA|nr:RNA recognition motif domain-containing protein [Ditylenchus destructor]
MYRRQQTEHRINEKDVPESQHALFVRGLPGHITTTAVREFFEEKIGPCSFDFIKTSPDRSKLYIAVRFETKEAAREAFDRYQDREILGYSVELSFFRDIRRYLNHLQKQGRKENHRRNNNDHSRIRRRRSRNSRSTSREKSITQSRSRSRSRSKSGSLTQSRSRSPTPSLAQSSPRSDANNNNDERGGESISAVKKSKKLKKDKKKKKHRTPSPDKSGSDMAMSNDSDGELLPDDGQAVGVSKTPTEEAPSRNGTASDTIASPPQADLEIRSPLFKNTTFTLELDSNVAPQQRTRKTEAIKTVKQNGTQSKPSFVPFGDDDELDPTEIPVKKFKESYVKRELKSPDITPPKAKLHSINSIPKETQLSSQQIMLGGAMTNFKNIQRMILQDVRYKNGDSCEDHVGNYRLSSLTTAKSAELMREERISKLSADLREKVEKKKLQLELSYRHDCQTFGLMTRKLIGKDKSLEDRLRLALLEVMKDLENEAMAALDEYIDQILILSS